MTRLRLALFLSALFAGAALRADLVVQVGPGNSFSPNPVTISPGETVTWHFNAFHSSTSDTTMGPEVWDSGQISSGDFAHTFTTPGSYPYYCSVHSVPGGTAMNGVVNVVAAVTPTPTRTRTATPTRTPTPTTTRAPTVTMTAPPTPTPFALVFSTLTPCRVVDTRDPDGAYGGPALQAGAVRVFVIEGQCGVPPGARAVAFNVTLTQPAAPGYVTLYPAGASLPLASTVNYASGETRANNAIAPLGSGGALAVFCGQAAGTAHFILDVTGYFE